MIRSTVEDFDTVARRLLNQFADDSTVSLDELQAFVDGCRYYCTGNLSWRYIKSALQYLIFPCVLIWSWGHRSLETGRYGVHQGLGQNEIHIRLGDEHRIQGSKKIVPACGPKSSSLLDKTSSFDCASGGFLQSLLSGIYDVMIWSYRASIGDRFLVRHY